MNNTALFIGCYLAYGVIVFLLKPTTEEKWEALIAKSPKAAALVKLLSGLGLDPHHVLEAGKMFFGAKVDR